MLHIDTYFLDDAPSARAFDVFEPEKITRDVVVFYVHGGGWTSGSRTTHHPSMAALRNLGYLCATTDYRLVSPGVNSKITAFDQLADIRESYEAFIKLAKTKIASPKAVVFGSSAGAHLASLLLTALPGECGEKFTAKEPWHLPAAGMLQSTPVSFEPWADIFPPVWNSMQQAAGVRYEDAPACYKALSLNNYIRKSNPPLLFLEAGNEHMFPCEMTLELVKKHQQWRIDSRWHKFDTAEHGFFYGITRRPQKEAFETILKFLEDIEKK